MIWYHITCLRTRSTSRFATWGVNLFGSKGVSLTSLHLSLLRNLSRLSGKMGHTSCMCADLAHAELFRPCSGCKQPKPSFATMPSKTTTYARKRKDAVGNDLTFEYLNNVSNWTLKSGKPDLSAQNAHEYYKGVLMSSWQRPVRGFDGSNSACLIPSADLVYMPPGFDWGALNNEAYAKFNGKLRKGSASLGVSLASWRQSREMITSRLDKTSRTLDRTITRLSGNRRARERLKDEREPLANQILETEFGWRPLIGDIHAALTTVCKDGIPGEWITGRARSTVYERSTVGSFPNQIQTWDGQTMVTYAAHVAISNPNLWLLNRLGLVNPATVAWDLVPWSFVVNMFLNVNQMISSITDEVGLEITGQSVTRSARIGYERMQWFDTDGNPWPGPSFGRVLGKYRSRTLGSRPPLSWQVKVPKLNWELCVVASSLVVQKFRKINELIKVL